MTIVLFAAASAASLEWKVSSSNDCLLSRNSYWKVLFISIAVASGFNSRPGHSVHRQTPQKFDECFKTMKPFYKKMWLWGGAKSFSTHLFFLLCLADGNWV